MALVPIRVSLQKFDTICWKLTHEKQANNQEKKKSVIEEYGRSPVLCLKRTGHNTRKCAAEQQFPINALIIWPLLLQKLFSKEVCLQLKSAKESVGDLQNSVFSG